MASFHTFADWSKIPAFDDDLNFGQGEEEVFGPMPEDSNNNIKPSTHFKVSSQFRLKSGDDVRAFAVTTGAVFLQPVLDESDQETDLVNLVLKPIPSPNIGIPIRYFIYRGLKRSDFVTESNGELQVIDKNGASEYINQLWEEFENQQDRQDEEGNQLTGSRPNPGRLGLTELFTNLSDDESIDYVFDSIRFLAKQTAGIEFAVVGAGDMLGTFKSGTTIGFDVVLEDPNFDPSVGIARRIDNVITAPEPVQGAVEGDLPFSEMRQREEVLSYLDPAVFYMLASYEGVGILVHQGNGTVSDPLSDFRDVYDQVVYKFRSRNRTYLDLRNQFGFSINLYKDNAGSNNNHFQLAQGNNSLVKENYYNDFWPVFYRELSNSSGNAALTLAFRTEFNPSPLMFLQYGTRGDHEDALPASSNVQSQQLVQEGELTFDDSISTGTDWSDPFVLLVNMLDDSAGTVPASIIKLQWIRRKDPDNLPDTAFKENEYHSNLVFLPPNEDLFPPQPGSEVRWKSTFGPKHFGGDNTSMDISLSPSFQLDFIVERGGAIGRNNIVLFARVEAMDSVRFQSYPRQGSGRNYTGSEFINVERELGRPIGSVTLSDVPLPGGNIPTLTSPFDIINADTRINYTFTKNEHEIIRNTALNAGLDDDQHPFYLVLKNEATDEDSEQNCFRRYDVFVAGIAVDSLGIGTYTEIGVTKEGDPLHVFTIDGFSFITRAASENTDLIIPQFTDEARLSVDELINFVGVAETARNRKFKNLKETFDEGIVENVIKDQMFDPTNMATRIRVHSYGTENNNISGLKEHFRKRVFEVSLDVATYGEYSVDAFTDVKLLKDRMDAINQEAYRRLTSHAIENGVRTNPSPYLQVPAPTVAQDKLTDLGQVFYGFESVAIPEFIPGNHEDGFTPITNEGFQDFKIWDTIDMANWPANLIIGVTNAVIHKRQNKTPFKEPLPLCPEPPDDTATLDEMIQRYYELSFPDPDFFGNVDAVGLGFAFSELENDNNLNANDPEDRLNLSDILTLYYKGKTAVNQKRSDEGRMSLQFNEQTFANVSEPYLVDNRMLMYSLFFGFAVHESGNTYRWRADSESGRNELINNTSIPEFTDANGKERFTNYEERFRNFAIMILNKDLNRFRTGNVLLNHPVFEFGGSILLVGRPDFTFSDLVDGTILTNDDINDINNKVKDVFLGLSES